MMRAVADRFSSLVGRSTARIMSASHRFPRRVLSLLLVLCIAALAGATTLRVDADSSRMISPELPTQRAARALNAAFPQLKSTILVTVTSDQADMADLATRALVDGLQGRPAIAEVFAPSTDPFLATHGFLYRDTVTLEEMFTRLTKSANLLANLRAEPNLSGFVTALKEAILLARRADIGPEALERLFAETASVMEAQTRGRPRNFEWSTLIDDAPYGLVTRLVSVTPRLDTDRLSPARPALDDIDAAIAALPAEFRDYVEVGVTGEPALRAEEMRSVTSTIGLSLSLSLVLVTLLLVFGLGGVRRAALVMGSLLVALVLTAGFAALAIGSLNLISVAFVVLMVGLGVDFAIHVLTHVSEEAAAGATAEEAVVVTGQRAGLALWLSAMTTALAFLAFTVTDFVGMAQLGVIGAGGVLIAWLVALTMIPAVLGLRPGLVAGRWRGTGLPIPTRPRWAVALVLGLTVASIWPATQARFDADPMSLRDQMSDSVQTFYLLASEPETSPYRASILVEGPAAADLAATRLEKVEGVAEAINVGDLVPPRQGRKIMLLDLAAPSIDHAIAGQPTELAGDADRHEDPLETLADLVDGMEGMAQRLSRAIAAYRAVRTETSDADLESRLFRSFGLLTGRLEAMVDARPVSVAALPAPMRERFRSADGIYRVEVLPRADLSDPAAARVFAASVRAAFPEAAGPAIQLAAAGEVVSHAMLTATLLSAVLTALLTLLATARWGDALAVLLPLMAAGLLVGGFSAVSGVDFNYANVIVLPLMIGIGVDSGIHLALRARRAPDAIFRTSTPRAVILSALTTILAFGTLALSDHWGTASMGILLTVAILATLLCVLVLTPALISWAGRNRSALDGNGSRTI